MSAAQAGMPSPRRVRSASPRGRSPSMIGSPRDYASSMGSPRGTPRAASPLDVLIFFQNSRIAAVAERARGRSPHGHGEIELIGKLKGLLDGGAITEAIFNAKRAELLARI